MKRKLAGFTLIELMIGLLLSSVFLLGINQILSQTRTNFRIQKATSDMMEDGRYIQDILGVEIRRVGFLRNRLEVGGGRANIFGPTGVNQAGTIYSIVTGGGDYISLINSQSISGVDGGDAGDSFVIRYQLNDALEVSSALSPCTRNLSLTGIEDPAIQRHVISIFFYVDNNVLQCVSRRDNLDTTPPSSVTSVAQPLIANVERIRVLYGQGNATGGLAYKTATQIATVPAPPTVYLGWGLVKSLRLSIVLFSQQQNLAFITPAAYTLNGNRSFDPENPAQNRLYRDFSVTVAFRNQGL